MLADDGFSKLLAAGLTATLAIQAFIIIGRRQRPDPAHGHHAPLRLLRRVEHRRELPPRRAPADRLEPCEPRSGERVNAQIRRLFFVFAASSSRSSRCRRTGSGRRPTSRRGAEPAARRAPADDQARSRSSPPTARPLFATQQEEEGAGAARGTCARYPTRTGSRHIPSGTRRSSARAPGSRSR